MPGVVNLLGAKHLDQTRDVFGANTEQPLEIKSRIDPTGIFNATSLSSIVVEESCHRTRHP